jgi:hypothetical protein
LLERLAVLVLQLVFYSYLVGLDMDFFDRLSEEKPDKAPIWKPVPVRQSGGELT